MPLALIFARFPHAPAVSTINGLQKRKRNAWNRQSHPIVGCRFQSSCRKSPQWHSGARCLCLKAGCDFLNIKKK
jgi:hypothetical protein